MEERMPLCEPPVGGAFLIEETEPDQVFIPEELDAETRLMARTIEEYVRKDVAALSDRIEAHEEGLMRSLVQKAGELGMLGANVPQIYGGLGLSFPAITYLTEKTSPNTSFFVF